MVKKNKQLQMVMIYHRYLEEYEENFPVERDSILKGIDYQMVVEMRSSFIQKYQIRTQVSMSYLSSDEEIHPLTENFQLTYAQLERDYDGTLVILLRAEIDTVTSRIEALEEKLDHIIQEVEDLRKQKTLIVQVPQEGLKKHQSLPQKMTKTASNHASDGPSVIDVGVLFSEPLVTRLNDKQVSFTAQPVKFREEIDRLNNSLRKTACGEITIKCLIASVEKLEFMLKYKVKILHIICHGLVETDKNKQIQEGVLCFEQFHQIGAMDKIYGRQIPQLLKNVPIEDRPKLVFVNACHSELIGDAFLNSGVPYVVVIQSSETIEDIAAQLFAQSFYNNLFNGMSVQKSFTNAKDSLDRQNRPVNSNICCCQHRLDVHEQGCLWKKLLQQMDKQTCHDLYHVPTCRCPKRHLSIHEVSCNWAIETLFNINKQFREKSEQVDRLPNKQVIAKEYSYLQICCCTSRVRTIPHDESEKFKFKHLPDADPNKSLIQTTLEEMNSQVDNTTPNELRRDFHAYQKLYGRNEDIYDLLKQILKPQKVLVVKGSVGSGRTGVVSKAVTYLIERGKFKDDYIHLNLSNCSKHIDFEFCFLRKIRGMKVGDYNEAMSKLALKQMVLVLDNADVYAQTAPKQFDNEVSYLMDRLINAKIIIITTDKTVLPLKMTSSIGSKILGPLKHFAAAEMFMIYSKQYIDIKNIEVDHREIRKLFANEKVRNPKTILDMVHFIKNQYTPTNKMPIAVLGQYIQNIIDNKTTIDKFLEENLSNLKKRPEVYQLLLFIAQFEGGLTELDFSIMSNQREIERSELTMVKMLSVPQIMRKTESDVFLSPNWRNLVNQLLAENIETSKGPPIGEGFMKEGEYYYCIIEQKAQGFKNIRVKKYILDYLKKFDRSNESDLKFKALAYLSNFSSILVKLFKEKYYYHEQLAEYSTISRCGFFQYEKSSKYYSLYGENEYFPDAIQDLSRSTSRGRQIDTSINDIFEGNPIVLERHPAESVLQHQQNFLQMYNNDYSQYYTSLPSQKKKLFKYYYHSILLNIPTLVKLAIEKSNTNFLKYCIDESIKKVNQLQAGRTGKSQNICTIKLLFMQVVHEISTRGKTQQLVSSYKNYFESIRLKMIWDKNSEITEMQLLDYYFLKAYIKYQNLRRTGRMQLEQYNKIIQLNLAAKRIVDLEVMRNSQGAKLLLAKFSLLLTEILLRLLDKDQYKNKFDMTKRFIDIEDAQRMFKLNKLVKLQADTLICQAKLGVASLKKKTIDDINQYFQIRTKYILPCRKLIRTEQYRLNAKDYEKELSDIEQKLDSKIWKITKNFLVFLKANPYVSNPMMESSKLNVVPFNGVKKKQMFRKAIESILCPNLNDNMTVKEFMPRSQKEISTKFEILSERNLCTILQQGCSILVLKVNVLMQFDTIQLQFENEKVPIEEKVNLAAFLNRVDFQRLNILILSGENTQLLAEQIAKAYAESPLIVTVDHQHCKHDHSNQSVFDFGYDQFSFRTLQHIAANYFICKLCESIVYSERRSSAEEITRMISVSKQQMVVYMMGFSKNTCSEDKINQLVKILIEQPTSKIIELQFQNGQFHDVSVQKSNLHNLKFTNSDSYVGREQLFYNIMKQLVQGRQKGEPSYINIYGTKGCGKSAFIEELGCMLLERGHFKSGIYMINGWEIETTFKGNINEYLQKHKTEIFHITYLNEQTVDGSQMLIIIDDFHAIKDRSNYLDYFFNSIYSNKVSLILTSNEQLTVKNIPDFKLRKLEPMMIKRLNELESMELSFMYIPLYDLDDFKEQYKNVFFELKKKQQSANQILPRNVMEEFRNLLTKANKKSAIEKYKNYKEYIVESHAKHMHPQIDIENNKEQVKGPHHHHRYHEEDSSKKKFKEVHSAKMKIHGRLENNFLK